MKQKIHFLPKASLFGTFFIIPFSFLTLLSFVIFLLSCSQPNENDLVTFSGTVTLEDTTDYSGVTVSLYKPVELPAGGRMPSADTALVRINQQYANIGFQISQETEFDHRVNKCS